MKNQRSYLYVKKTLLSKNKRVNLFWSISFILFINMLTALSVFAGDNLLKNGSFEEPSIEKSLKVNWWTLEKKSIETTVTRRNRSYDAQSGELSFKITLKNSLGGAIPEVTLRSQAFDIAHGLYILKGWYKTTGKTKAGLIYTTIDVSGVQTETFFSELPQAKEWSEFILPVNVRHHYKINTGYLKKYLVERLSVELFATEEGEVYFDNVSLVKSDDPIVLRMFPAEFRADKKIPFIKGAPNFLRIMLRGEKERITAPVEILLDMPVGTEYYSEFNSSELVTTNGDKCVRYRIKIPESEIKRLKKETRHASVMCWFNADKLKGGEKVYYRAIMDGKEYTQKEVTIKMLPKLPLGPRPKRFRRIVSWSTFGDTYHGTVTSNYLSEDLYPAVYDMMRGIGLNCVMIFPDNDAKGWRKYFINRMRKDGGEIWANIPKGFAKKFLHHTGWETDVIAGGVEGIAKLSGDYYTKALHDVDAIHFDFEPYNAENNPLWEHIPTRKAFAKKYGYDVNSLTTKRLKGELRAKWLAFRTWQLGEALTIWAKYVHSVNPNWEVTVSQGDGYPMGKYIDYGAYTNKIPKLVNMPQIYISPSIGVVRNVMALQKHFPDSKWFPVITAYMTADKSWPAKISAKTLYSHNTALAMLAVDGVAQWPDVRRGMDMEYIWETTRAMRDIAYLEDYAYKGKVLNNVDIKATNSDVDWKENSFARAYQLNDKVMIAFNNMDKTNNAEVEVKLNDIANGNWKIINPVTGKRIVTSDKKSWSSNELKDGFNFSVPASTLGLLVISKD